MIQLREGEELEILVEGIRKSSVTTICMGINIFAVPIRAAGDVLATALKIADGVIGIKVSLAGHYLVIECEHECCWCERCRARLQFQIN